MKIYAQYFLAIIFVVGCNQSNNNNVNDKVVIVDTSESINTHSNYIAKEPEEVIRNDMEFFALAKRVYLPTSYNLDGANGYFSNLMDANLPLLNEENVINDSIKNDILNILKKQYSNKYDVSQYLFNNEYCNYRMLGIIINYREKIISKIIYREAETTSGIHIGFVFMVNMDFEMETNISNAVIAIEIGAEAGNHHFIKLSSDLKLDAQNNIIVKQNYQIDHNDSEGFIENTKRTIVINICGDCKVNKRSFVTYK